MAFYRISKKARSAKGKRVTVMFQSTLNDRTVWAKSFRSQKSADKAIKGISKKTNNKPIGERKTKGFKFGAMVKRLNRSKRKAY